MEITASTQAKRLPSSGPSRSATRLATEYVTRRTSLVECQRASAIHEAKQRGHCHQRTRMQICSLLLLLELGIDQVVERKDLVPLLLAEKLFVLHYNVVEAFTRLDSFSRKLGTLLIAERRLEQSHNAQGIEHHVARALVIGSNALHTVYPQAIDSALHRRDRGEERESDHRLHDVELQLPGRGGKRYSHVEPDHEEAGLVHHFRDHGIHFARHDRRARLHLRQINFVQAAARSRSQHAKVIANLGKVDRGVLDDA